MLRRASLSAIALLLFSSGSASAGSDHQVEMFNYGFNPASVNIPVGYSVHWHNGSNLTHTATSNKFDLFDKTVSPSQTSSSFVFARAGTWSYHCEIHPEMQGRVRASMLAQPYSGTVETTFVLRVATEPLPPGHVEDIQKRRQGPGTWKVWRTTSNQTVNWTPGKLGAWQLRARLRNPSTGERTGWSSVIAISVTG